jgi:hypothetical protein
MFIAEKSEKTFKLRRSAIFSGSQEISLLRSSKSVACSGSINISSLRDLGSSTSKRELHLLRELWRWDSSL